MLLPRLPIVPQVAAKRLLPPGTLGRVRDGRPGADTLVRARVLEVEGQRAVAAHGVARDGDVLAVELGEGAEDEVRQLLGEVRLHLVVRLPGVLGGVNVKGRGAAKVVGVVLAGQVRAAGARVREQQSEAEGRGVRVEEALLGDIVGRAGEARQVDEHRGWLGGGGARREEEGEVHVGAGCGGLVGELEELAPEGGDGGIGGEGHDGCDSVRFSSFVVCSVVDGKEEEFDDRENSYYYS